MKKYIRTFLVFYLIALSFQLLGGLIAHLFWQGAVAKTSLPNWIPPRQWIPIIWSLIFIGIGISGTVLWVNREKKHAKIALTFWIATLILNLLWVLFYYYFRDALLTSVDLTLLLLTVCGTIGYSFLIHKGAGYCLIPFALWVTYLVLFHWNIYLLGLYVFY